MTAGGGGGVTDWAGMSIGEVLAIIGTMNSGAASGDAEALEALVKRAAGLVSEINDGANTASQTHAAATSGAQAAGATQALTIYLTGLRNDLRENPERSAEIRAAVQRVMTTYYSHPMNDASASVPTLDTAGSTVGRDAVVPVGGAAGSGGGGAGSS